jgi:predicted RNA-binding protein with PUA-like domain
VAGLLRVCSPAKPDPTQFERGGEYEDPKSPPENPRWLLVDVEWAADLPAFVGLPALRADPALAEMLILRRGNRLSITPVEAAHFRRVCQLGGLNTAAIQTLLAKQG